MADEIQPHQAIDMGQTPLHDGGSSRSLQATEQPRSKIMYETAAALLRMKGYRLQLFLNTLAIILVNVFIWFKEKNCLEEFKKKTHWGMTGQHWITFLLYISETVVVNSFIICWILPRVEKKFLLNRKKLYFIHGLKIKFATLLCCIVALITWFFKLRPYSRDLPAGNTPDLPERQTPAGHTPDIHAEQTPVDKVFQTVIALLVGSILWLIKSMLLLVLASSFCCNRFFDRVKESLAHQYVINVLSKSQSQGHAEPEPRSAGSPAAQGEAQHGVFACIHRFKEGVCTWPHVLLCGIPDQDIKIDICELLKVPRDEFPLYTRQLLVDAISDSVTWTFQEKGHWFKAEDLPGDTEAANDIFRKIANSNKSDIELKDLENCLTSDLFEYVRPMLEVEKDGHITSQSFSTWMVKACHFRMVLKGAIADNKKHFNRLTMVSNGIMGAAVLLLWLTLVKIANGDVIIVIITQVAAAAFIFGESVKKAFEGVVFLFIVHPFDVGDCCIIGGIPVVIERMSILTTTVKKFDEQSMHYPNATLATLPISNYTRNPHMGDTLEFFIDLMTPEEKVKDLTNEIKSYLRANSYHWQPEYSLVTKEIDGMDKMKMVLNVKHTISFREFVVRDQRKFALIMELGKILKKLKLKNEVNIS